MSTGLKVTRPELDVWVATGDGDALSSRRQPTIHMLRPQRRAEDPAVQQQIYGLTKGQYSPHLRVGKKAKSTPYGSGGPAVQRAVAGAGGGSPPRGAFGDVFQSH